jgi:DNA replication protein DnaC
MPTDNHGLDSCLTPPLNRPADGADAAPSRRSRWPNLEWPRQPIPAASAPDEFEARQRAIKRSINMDRLSRELGERYSPERVQLDRFERYHSAQIEAIASIQNLFKSWPTALREGHGLVLFGPVGVGKDALMALALYTAVEHDVSACWVGAQELWGRLRDGMDTHLAEGQVFQPLIQAGVLGLSDPVPPGGDLSPWETTVLTRLIDCRYRQLRPTFLALNVASEKDAESRLSPPVYDRIREGATIVHCNWPSYRQRRKPAAAIPDNN